MHTPLLFFSSRVRYAFVYFGDVILRISSKLRFHATEGGYGMSVSLVKELLVCVLKGIRIPP